MRSIGVRICKLWFIVTTAACSVGDVSAPGDNEADPPAPTQAAPVETIDDDGDGIADGIDLDGDGIIDIDLDDIVACEPLVDSDGDGVRDGIDFDCDGTVDVAVDVPPELMPPDLEDLCIPALVDGGIDLDCDGMADVTF